MSAEMHLGRSHPDSTITRFFLFQFTAINTAQGFSIGSVWVQFNGFPSHQYVRSQAAANTNGIYTAENIAITSWCEFKNGQDYSAFISQI